MNLCGTCKVCCDRPAIFAVKAANSVCQYYRNNECSIYSNRPAVCKAFNCSWLQSDLPIEFRPDHIGAMAYAKQGPRMILAEAESGSFNLDNLSNLQKTFFAAVMHKADQLCTPLTIMGAS